jgi:chromosome segregation ATPase
MRAPPKMNQKIGRRIDRLPMSGRGATPEEVADFAEDGRAFVTAVEAELHSWDAYIERLQVKAAMAGRAREQAEAAISELRRHRNSLGERLRALRSESTGAWSEGRASVDAARAELGRRAAEIAAGFGRGAQP